MDPRRRAVAVLAGRAIALELVEAVERDVEPVAAFVLDDRHLERRLAGRDRLDAAVDADAVLEMHHVVALDQRSRGGGGGGLAVAARTAQAARAAEDLVVGEDPERRHDEAAVERADRERGPHAASALLQQLLEPLELALVVAQDERRR